MTDNDVRNLIDLLRIMRKRDPDHRVYGSGSHRYRIGPALPESELLAFEQQHRITLPEDYRRFLKEVGTADGGRNGAGPGCGLEALPATVESSDLSEPFPLTDTAVFETFPETEAWGMEEPYRGALAISYYGGPDFILLVVNGPTCGTVWKHDVEFGFYPTGLTFWEWYRQWTDFLTETALPKLDRDRVADQVTEGMTRDEVIALCGPTGGGWQVRPLTDDLYDLRFEHLLTTFRMTKENRVESLIRFGLSQKFAGGSPWGVPVAAAERVDSEYVDSHHRA